MYIIPEKHLFAKKKITASEKSVLGSLYSTAGRHIHHSRVAEHCLRLWCPPELPTKKENLRETSEMKKTCGAQ